MTKNERDHVVSFIDELEKRINEAKVAIRECNYGFALNILSQAYPILKIKVDG